MANSIHGCCLHSPGPLKTLHINHNSQKGKRMSIIDIDNKPRPLLYALKIQLIILATMLFGGALFAQDKSVQSIPPMLDQLRKQYTPADYQNFLQQEQAGRIPLQSGPIFSPEALDILGNNNAGAESDRWFTQSETSILAYGSTVILGFNDSGSRAGLANKFTGWSYSFDGGATFTDGGTLPTNPGGDAGDPVLAMNESTGRIYYATLGFSVSTIQVFRSDDNGVTWMAPVNGTPGGSVEDKQWMAVDNFPGAGSGNVYLISRNFGSGDGIYMYRSTDHGATFGPSGGVQIVSGYQGAFVAVGPDHAVYAFWWAGSTLQVRKSTDFGVTFGSAVTVASGLTGGGNGDLGLTGIRQGTATPSGFRSNSFPHVAVNPVSGHLYATFNDNPAGTDKADVYMVMSTDGGATWSARVRVNDDATTTDQWQPTIAVTPSGDGIGVFYYSREEDPVDNNLFKYYGRTGFISGSTVTFTPSFAISDVASLPEFGRDANVNSTYMGDYNQAAATATAFHVVWSDNRDDLPGGASSQKDPNIYYESIPAGILSGPNITVYPSSVDFSAVAVTQTGDEQITVINNGDADLTVSAISSPAADFSLTAPSLPAVIPSLGYITLTAHFTPASLGVQNSSFDITSDALNDGVVTVNLTGTGVENIRVTPLSVDFGSVPVGQTSGASAVVIENSGTVNLTISGISTPGGDFSVTNDPLPIVLLPLGTTTVNAFFSPTTDGPHSSSFDVSSDAIGAPTVTVSLQGEGITTPSNDLCVNAIPIDCGSTIDGTTVLATFDDVGFCGTSNTAPGVWYTVAGTGQSITVSTCLAASYDTKLTVFEGSCGALVCVGGNDDFCGLRSQVTFNSVLGTTYYVLVHGFSTATGTFTLSTSSCPAEISVSPADLTFVVPPDGSGSDILTITNSASPGALDLEWHIIGGEGALAPGQGAESWTFPQPVAQFQITEETINILHSMHLPTAIWTALESLISQPPADKESFVSMINGAIGEGNMNTFYTAIMENSVQFFDELKGQPEVSGTAIGGPDGFGYEFIDSDEPGGPVFNWADITGTGTPVSLGDDDAILVPLPFTFSFYGIPQTEIRISSNGYLTFGTSGLAFTNSNIPNSAGPNDIICPFWEDLNPTQGGTIHYLSTATQFIVQYSNIPRYFNAGSFTFQVILNDDGSMLFQYLDMQGELASSTVGIENATGTIGLQVVFNAPYIHNNLAVLVTMSPPCPWVSSIVPSSGTTPAGSSQQVTVDVDATGLPYGIYQCQLSILSNAVNAARVDVPLTLVVSNLHPYVLLADKDVIIDRQVNSEGDIHANNDIEFEEGKPGTHTGNLTAVDDITIDKRNTINGDARAGDNIKNKGTITGTVEENAGIPEVDIPEVEVDHGSDDIDVGKHETVELDPGSYDDIKVDDYGTLVLRHDGTSGEYNVDNLKLDEKAILIINAGNGPVTVNVNDELKFDKAVEVVILPSELYSWLVTFNVESHDDINIGSNAKVLGTIIAPEALVTLGTYSTFKGAICAEDIEVEKGATFLHHSSSTSISTAARLLAGDPENLDSEESTETNPIPTEYDLSQNFPNPFNPTTTIKIALPEAAQLTLKIYNIRGQLVRTLINSNMEAGYHLVQWDGMSDTGTKVASGMYFYRISAGSFVQTKKMILMK